MTVFGFLSAPALTVLVTFTTFSFLAGSDALVGLALLTTDFGVGFAFTDLAGSFGLGAAVLKEDYVF